MGRAMGRKPCYEWQALANRPLPAFGQTTKGTKMLSLVLRVLGLLIFSAGIVALVGDGIRSIAADRIALTSIRASWSGIDAASLSAFETFVHARLSEAAADMVLTTALGWPTPLAAGLTGLALMAAGRRRQPKPRHLSF